MRSAWPPTGSDNFLTTRPVSSTPASPGVPSSKHIHPRPGRTRSLGARLRRHPERHHKEGTMNVEMLNVGWFTAPAGILRKGDDMDRTVRFPVPAYVVE